MTTKLRPYRKDADYSYAIGVFATLELLAHKSDEVQQVLLSSKGQANQGVTKISEICGERGIPVRIADAQVERLAGSEGNYAIHLVLVNPSDAGNLGAIARTMLGFEMLDLAVIRPATDIWDPRTIRASMGAIFQLRCEYFGAFAEYRARFGQRLYPLMTDGQQNLGEVRPEAPYALVFGNEGAGLGPEFHTLGDSVRIAHSQRIDSLNLAVSVGIALYVATWQANRLTL
jgi:TrmH family RNA methyltransferase